jgi:HemY protein
MLKRRLFWWLLMFLLLIGSVWLASNNQGYVLVVRAPYRLQFSFNFFLVVMVLSFLAMHYCLRLVHFLRRLPANRRSKKEAMRLKAGNTALLEGMHALAEGDYEKAARAAKRAQVLIQNSDLDTLINRLSSQGDKPELQLPPSTTE